MKRAVDYAHLIGKHVRMERDNLDGGDPPTHGMECFVVGVWDIATVDGKHGVEICGDYGMGYTIWEHDEDEWHFAVTAGEQWMRDLTKWGQLPQTFGMAQKRAQS